jgi:predicted 3-demethylubiquinone-9 3-methyltransferase (glyoxalase superfamily)
MQQKIVPNLWFDTEALEAAEYYMSIFDDAKINNVSHYNDAGPREAGMVLTVDWEMNGTRFTGINGGPQFKFSEAVSFLIECKDQAEVDYYWEKLGEGGEHGPCGWLKDKFGLSWQVVPDGFVELVTEADPERASRAMAAMMKMGKLDLAELRAAADGAPAASA